MTIGTHTSTDASSRDPGGWLAHHQDVFNRTLRPPNRVALLLAASCAAVAFLVFVMTAPHGFELGDAPYYAGYIAERALGYATKHIGYYLLGIGFTTVVPLQLDYALNVLAALTSALSVGLTGLIAYTLTGRRTALVAASAALMVPYVFATQGVNAEVYSPQLAFFLLAVVSALWNHPVASGLAFAAAFLITPSTALAAPFILLLRPTKRFISRWLPAAALPVVAVLVPVYRDFLFGPHGVANMPPATINFTQGLRKEAQEMLGFSFALVPMLVGLTQIAASTRHRLFAAALTMLWGTHLVFGERYPDVPVQLPLYALLAALAGVGCARLLHLVRDNRAAVISLATLLIIMMAVPAQSTYSNLREEAALVETTKASMVAMGRAATHGDAAVAPFAVTLLGRYYLDDEPLIWIHDESLAGKNGTEEQVAASAALAATIEQKRAVWLPGDFDESAFDYFATVGYTVEPFESVWVARPAASH